MVKEECGWFLRQFFTDLHFSNDLEQNIYKLLNQEF